jgi:hypothetical protein
MSYDDANFEYCSQGEAVETHELEVPPPPGRHPQRPLDDFEVRRTASGAFEVVFCGSRYDPVR